MTKTVAATFICTIVAFGVGMACRPSIPPGSGVSVDVTDSGGVEACITLARKSGCVCPAPDGGGR